MSDDEDKKDVDVEAAVAATDAVVVDVDTNDVSATPPPAEQPPPLAKLNPATVVTPTVSPPVKTISTSDYRAMAQLAAATAKLDRLAGGSKSVFKATMADIGALGIGMQLYFMLTKYLATTFFCMGLIALPTIILNKAGHGITSKMADPLQLAYASLGNQGVHEDIASDPRQCLPRGNIDCNWTTVDTPFTEKPLKVAWIITISDCLYSLVFLLFWIVYRYRAKRAIEEHMNENLTPAKYAVYVRGLPSDATEAEILRHFNNLYDLTKEEEYFPLWFGCCWGRRRKVKNTLSRNAVNRSVVKNVDHLAGTTSITKELYIGTWIAEVSVGHPTGGLLRTFLSMEALTRSIAETRTLIKNLEEEKKMALSAFKPRDEKLIHASKKRLDKLCEQLEKKKSKISTLKKAADAIKKQEIAERKAKEAEAKANQNKRLSKTSASVMHASAKGQQARAKVAAAAKAARTAALATKQAFNWEACECAFVVFNNLESRRRCLRDYRYSTSWLPHKFQPELLRFRDGKYPLMVVPAPEPSNILWENLEVTDRGRFYRRSLTNFITFLLLLASAMIISGAQSAQQQFKDKMPPPGLCDRMLPEVFYGSTAYNSKGLKWNLEWYRDRSCPAGSDGKVRYHIAYDNGILNALTIGTPANPADPSKPPFRCTDPCVSETSDTTCATLPCFDKNLQDNGRDCETYSASHTLYCLCTNAFTDSVEQYGLVEGPKRLWNDVTPCRGFITDYAKKNGLIMAAAAVVVVVNMLLNTILRGFATFERHSSESAKATAIAAKMFLSQFLNTAVIVLIVNTSLGLSRVPVLKELLKGKYRDFERDWYPTVGMGITTTMLINAFVPQLMLFLQMFVIAPLRRCLQRRSIRTQEKMNQLYAGPPFDISVRYPMVLNSLFVTMVFSGGSPILLFIAAVTAFGTYWFDKLSILHLYSVKTAYDEELGELAITLLPWTLVLHLGFSAWMYGNGKLMKATTIDLPWVLKRIGMKYLVDTYGNENSDALYAAFVEEASKIDLLGKYGFAVKVVKSNVMVVFLFMLGAIGCILVSMVWLTLVYPLICRIWNLLVRCFCGARRPVTTTTSDSDAAAQEDQASRTTKKGRKPPPPPVIIPEFTDVFRKSVKPRFRPDHMLGFQRNEKGELTRVWQEEVVLNGMKRVPGQEMRTWEAMQAPVKSYAIEMNEKYRLAVAEIVAASKMLRMGVSENKVVPMSEDDAKVEQITAGITATEPVTSPSLTPPAVSTTESKETVTTLAATTESSGTTTPPVTTDEHRPTSDGVESVTQITGESTEPAAQPADESVETPAVPASEAKAPADPETGTDLTDTTADAN